LLIQLGIGVSACSGHRSPNGKENLAAYEINKKLNSCFLTHFTAICARQIDPSIDDAFRFATVSQALSTMVIFLQSCFSSGYQPLACIVDCSGGFGRWLGG
jgi:hypothetical protein